MKRCYLLIFFLLPFLSFAQLPQQDSSSLLPKNDSAAAGKDSMATAKDSVVLQKDSIAKAVNSMQSTFQRMIEEALQQSRFVQSQEKPVASVSKEMPAMFNEALFYMLLALVLFFAFLRFLYERYFNNMFRVFFNTSLRQSQLTDQLLQAKQVSLLFNILFILTGGLYIYFLLTHFKWLRSDMPVMTIGICTVCLAFLYFFKYCSLRFTGWITGYNAAASTYLFIIFLINKILGVLLLPFVIVVAFGKDFLQTPAALVSLLMIGLMFVLRFLRSYSLLRKDIKVSRWHFFIYIIGVEVLPLLLIYKALVVLLGKNL
ncbi:MAG TPA: DUF4271 domain-containing protein [Ferruginibacter sp.]|nr:DUF4271 domain-containing protein [Ferruginibacter sp.]HPH89280.1 DUF4271 domain-containing protein [Ferruginibacter sp.]